MTDRGKQLNEASESKIPFLKQWFLKKTRKVQEDTKLKPSTLPVHSSLKEEPSYPLYVAKHSYSSRAHDDLSFKKGDLLYIINKDEGDRWFAKTKETGQEGYISSYYVTKKSPEDAKLKSSTLPSEKSSLEGELTHLLFVGIYDFSAITDDDLSFRRGDLLYVMNPDEGDWWLARSKQTGQEGYIPRDYVTELKSDLDDEM